MGANGVNDLVKFDSRTIDLTTPAKGPKRSFFGTVFQTVSLLSAPAWLFPGIGTAIGASAMGLGVVGNHMQNRKMSPRYETTAAPYMNQLSTPGLDGGGAPAGAAFSSDPALSIIAPRQASMNEIPQAIGGGR